LIEMGDPQIQSLMKLQVLMTIEKGPVCGYALMARLGELTGKPVSPSQVYPFLYELKKNGLLKAGKSGARDKKSYSLTHEGKRLVSQLVGKLGSVVDFAVKNRIKTCLHCGAEIYSGEFKKGKKFFCCPHCAAAYEKKA
jgi:DNA-binding PadR family transcriptional regulator